MKIGGKIWVRVKLKAIVDFLDIHLEDVDLSSEMEDLVEPELDELKSIKREINNLTEATQLSRSRNPSVVESEGKLLNNLAQILFYLGNFADTVFFFSQMDIKV